MCRYRRAAYPPFDEEMKMELDEYIRHLQRLQKEYAGLDIEVVHHSTIFELNVESYRRRTASDKQKERRRQLQS
jgi:hypothetical protein